jgi:glycosyltransferase involved in cell wall biosynthesis
MFFISIIIPAYNRGHFIGITLDSFINQNYPKDSYEIIVADNNSKDNTAEVIKEFISKSEIPITYLIEKRQGVHFSRNTAARLAKGDILYYTDDDMIADSNLLKEIALLFEMDSKIGSATGKVLPKWASDPPAWILKYCNNYYLSLNDLGENIIISEKDMGVFSCHQAMRKDVFMKSGGFNPENTMGEWIGDGETGLNIKIKSLGYKFAYNPASVIYHIIPAERTTQRYLNKRLKNQGNCDSYTDFRSCQFGYRAFISQFRSYSRSILLNMFWFLRFRISNNEEWHIRRANICYFIARIKYDFRLMHDQEFKSMVLKTDWLNE